MKILIIDDETNICLSLKNILEDEGYRVEFALTAREGMAKVESFQPELVLLDVRLDGANGLELLEKLRPLHPEIIFIMISGHSGIKEAVKAIKLGAYDFLEKPLSLSKVKISINNAAEYLTLNRDYQMLKASQHERYQIIGTSSAIQELKAVIVRVAPTDAKVLIRGESGTGKELIAYAIHNLSQRCRQPFVKFNTAAIPNELVESELFGFEKGAFTGAVHNKDGKIERADGGTLFLDEIGDMNLQAQAKILRVIQEGEFERVGGNQTRKIDTRIIAATHKNLEQLVEEGSFREDLYYRLNVFPVISPPLRQHPEDIPVLISHYSEYYARELKIGYKRFSEAACREMSSWQFRGNVRELKNIIERLYIMTDSDTIGPGDLELLQPRPSPVDFWNQTANFKDKKREFEINYLQTQLRLHGGNLTSTAQALGLQISNLSRKLKELAINPEEVQ
ncbi:MAG: sigma-54-dependent Fis family transcriptional regulator [Candidatus Cloacimonetes bacterium]|nr:sigma-54-dependent Fis family transcriptional regulator [Candidatus Cloacimonadota bacterium]